MSYAILVIEDEASLGQNIQRYLELEGYDASLAASAEAALEQIPKFLPDFVLLDLKLPGLGGMDALPKILELLPDAKIVIMTAHGSVQVAVDAMKLGAWDYLSKPVILSDLKRLIQRARGEEKVERSLSYYRQREVDRISSMDAMLGKSPSVRALKSEIEQLKAVENSVPERAQAPVLVIGETGTGKELVARALHFSGPRGNQPFIALNCATLPHHLVEGELFGHERGAFTDAKERKIGLIEAAEGGTLFLDEIGDLDLSLQTKLLTVLESRTIRRVGAIRERCVDVRFIAATHQPLETLVAEGKFRSDLYFRLRIVQFQVPALRDRGQDIILLAHHYLNQFATRYRRPALAFSPVAEQALLNHFWPGNVRELRNVIEQAVLLTKGDLIDPPRLALSPLNPAFGESSSSAAMVLPPTGIDLDDIERSLIQQALDRTNWNVTAAARLLHLTRDTLRYRIDKFDLKKTAERVLVDEEQLDQ